MKDNNNINTAEQSQAKTLLKQIYKKGVIGTLQVLFGSAVLVGLVWGLWALTTTTFTWVSMSVGAPTVVAWMLTLGAVSSLSIPAYLGGALGFSAVNAGVHTLGGISPLNEERKALRSQIRAVKATAKAKSAVTVDDLSAVPV